MIIWGLLTNRWVVLLLGIVFMMIGLLPELTTRAVRMVGKMGWAEQRFGEGGTFTVWKWIGILAPIAAMIYFFTGGYSPTNGWFGTSVNQDVQTDSSYESYY